MTVVMDQAEDAPSMGLENDYDFGPSPAFAALTKDVENSGASSSNSSGNVSGLLKPLAPLSLSSGNKAPLPKLGKLPQPTLISIAEEPTVSTAKKINESEAEKAARRAARKKEKALRNSKDGQSLRKSRDKSLRHSRESADEPSVGAPTGADISIDSVASMDGTGIVSGARLPATNASTSSSSPLVVGTVVEARYGSKGTWFKGTITAVHDVSHQKEGTATTTTTTNKYDIAYDDGDKEFGVARLRVRRCGEEQPSGLLAPGTPCEARLGTKCYPATVTAAHTATGGDSETTYSVQYADGDFEKHVARNLIFVQCEYPHTTCASNDTSIPDLQESATENIVAPETSSEPVPLEPEVSSLELEAVADVPPVKEVKGASSEQTAPVNETENTNADVVCASEPAPASTSAGDAAKNLAAETSMVADDSNAAVFSAAISSVIVKNNNINGSDEKIGDSQHNQHQSLTPTEEAAPTDLANEEVTEEAAAVAKKLFAETTSNHPEQLFADAFAVAECSSAVVAAAATSGTADKVAEPELAPLVVGERVEGRYGGGEEWFSGQITAVHHGGIPEAAGVSNTANIDTVTFDVAYDDGDEECGVVRLRLRRQGDEALEVLSRGTRCEARYGGGLKCYPGTIAAVASSSSAPSATTSGKSYTVAYDDGDEEVGVARELIFVQCGPLAWRKQQMLANAKFFLDERNAQGQESIAMTSSAAVEESGELVPETAPAPAALEFSSEPNEEEIQGEGSSIVKRTERNEVAATFVPVEDGPSGPSSSEEPVEPLTMEVEPAPATAIASATPEFMGTLGSPPPLKVLLAHAKKLGVEESQTAKPSKGGNLNFNEVSSSESSQGSGGGNAAAQWARVPKAVQQLVMTSLQAPLPTGWVLQPDKPAHRYLNQWTKQAQPQHPLDEYYREKVQETICDLGEAAGSNFQVQPPREMLKPDPVPQPRLKPNEEISSASEEPQVVASAMATAEAAAAAAVAAAASMAKELAVTQALVNSLSTELKVAQDTIRDLQSHRQSSAEEVEQEVQPGKGMQQPHNSKRSRQSSFGKLFSALRGRRNERIMP